MLDFYILRLFMVWFLVTLMGNHLFYATSNLFVKKIWFGNSLQVFLSESAPHIWKACDFALKLIPLSPRTLYAFVQLKHFQSKIGIWAKLDVKSKLP